MEKFALSTNTAETIASRRDKPFETRHNKYTRQQPRSLASLTKKLSSSVLSGSATATLTMSQVEMVALADNRGEEGLYTGCICNETKLPHGYGRMEYYQGAHGAMDLTYDGHWLQGDWNGFGKLVQKCASGGEQVYEGSFMDNRRHGLGVLSFPPSLVTYDFAFQFGKLGKGRITHPDGTLFWGYVNDDLQPHGRGKLTFSDGAIYDGEFQNGRIEGHGRMTLADGQWYLGEWMDGKKHGLGLDVAADGTVGHEGTFCNGHPVTCSSFPRRVNSQGGMLVYTTSPNGAVKALVGPIPSKISVDSVFGVRLPDP